MKNDKITNFNILFTPVNKNLKKTTNKKCIEKIYINLYTNITYTHKAHTKTNKY